MTRKKKSTKSKERRKSFGSCLASRLLSIVQQHSCACERASHSEVKFLKLFAFALMHVRILQLTMLHQHYFKNSQASIDSVLKFEYFLWWQIISVRSTFLRWGEVEDIKILATLEKIEYYFYQWFLYFVLSINNAVCGNFVQKPDMKVQMCFIALFKFWHQYMDHISVQDFCCLTIFKNTSILLLTTD